MQGGSRYALSTCLASDTLAAPPHPSHLPRLALNGKPKPEQETTEYFMTESTATSVITMSGVRQAMELPT